MRRSTNRDQQTLFDHLLTADHEPAVVEEVAGSDDESGFPDDWIITTIGAIAAIKTGKTPPTSDKTFFSGHIPFFKPGDLDDPSLLYEAEEHLSIEGSKKAGLLPVGAVLVSCIGNLGKVGLLEVEASCNQQINAILPSERLIPKYVFYWARQIKPWLIENASATTVTIINKGRFENAPIPLPPLAEQRRIVATLDRLFARSKRARDELAHVPRLVERMKQAVLASAFSGELTQEWRTISVTEVSEAISDGPFGSNLKSDDYVSEGVRVIRLENIAHLNFIAEKKSFISFEKYEGLKRHTVQEGDVLFSSFIDEEIRVCLYPGDPDRPAINKADCFCIRVNKGACDPRFLLYRLASHFTYESLKETVHGATRPRINLGQLKKLSIRPYQGL